MRSKERDEKSDEYNEGAKVKKKNQSGDFLCVQKWKKNVSIHYRDFYTYGATKV